MIPSDNLSQKSNLYLNRFVTSLAYPPATFKVHYWGSKPSHFGNNDHTHTFFEICYVADGEGIYLNDGISYKLTQGTLYATKPGSRHRITSTSGMLLLFVAFELDPKQSDSSITSLYVKLSNHSHLFIPHAQETSVVYLWKALLLQAEQLDKGTHPEWISRLAHGLLCSAIQLFHEHSGQMVKSQQAEAASASIPLTAAQQYVHAHVTRKLTIKDVASAIHLSSRQLSRILSEELGQTFPSWIRTERIRSAVYLLAYTDKSIQEIAEDTGFETANYFTRVFQEMMHITPGKFRKVVVSGKPEAAEATRVYLRLLVGRHQH